MKHHLRSNGLHRQRGVSVYREEQREFSTGDSIQFTAPAKAYNRQLLQKLGNANGKNKLFLVAQEVGRVVSTVHLLEWINSSQLRAEN